ncbi:RloB family protein [uncultured Acidaminococcus sp.]|jgi:hypothetical protein|uniref:RloB family protein n=1 Tax=uncultured Acidaminococcus sp. TaxID=352152 RepID=UPI002676D702|nr:RloB family protein [uncultured Acidaminococcus sp.]
MVAFMQKSRGKRLRKRKKIIFIGAEGKNKTETKYFNSFNRLQDTYIVKFACNNHTDPKGMVTSIHKEAGIEGITGRNGDEVYVLLDADSEQYKEEQIKEAISIGKNKNVNVIISNPCFELWFLLHFEYTTKYFSSNRELIKELKRYIKNYEKNLDVFTMLEDKQMDALKNAKKLHSVHAETRKQLGHVQNPETDIDILVDKLKS